MKTFLACMGTRPEIIKMAILCRVLRAQGHRVVVLHTGQHEEMAHALYRFFDMPPDIVPDLQRKSGSLSHLTAALIENVEEAMEATHPDVVMVQGDTTSAMAGALVGSYHHCPVAHIEAGLRTYEREPFPEEMNRQVIGRLAHWHFAPTEQAKLNLLSEGVSERCIYEVGNTVIDAALWTRDHIAEPAFPLEAFLPAPLQQFLALHKDAPLVLVTAHRRENWGDPIRDIATAVALILEENPGAVALWPLHPNPSVREDVAEGLAATSSALRSRILFTEPLGYPAMIHLLSRARLTLTDSGGIQEEASALGIPVLIARESTERQELIDDGGAALVGTEVGVMVAAASSLLENAEAHAAMCIPHSPFGDGRSAERIARILSERL